MITQAERNEFRAAADLYAPLVARIIAGADGDGTAAEKVYQHLAAELAGEGQYHHKALPVPSMPKDLESLGLPTDNHPQAIETLERRLQGMTASQLRLFSEHRIGVTDIEARNAQRLFLLASAGLRSKTEDVLVTIGGFMGNHWKSHQRFFQLSVKNLRQWSQVQMRDYDALPVIWRHVDLPAIKAAKQEDER